MARRVEAEGLLGADVGHGDDEAAGAAVPEQGDVDAVRVAVRELSHVDAPSQDREGRSTLAAPRPRTHRASRCQIVRLARGQEVSGTDARTVVPPPGGDSIVSVPSSAS